MSEETDNPEIHLLIEEDQREGFVEFLLELNDSGVSFDIPMEKKGFNYRFDPGLKITYLVFVGEFWVVPVAQYLNRLKQRGVKYMVEATVLVNYAIVSLPLDTSDQEQRLPLRGTLEDIGRLVAEREHADHEPLGKWDLTEKEDPGDDDASA